MRNFNSLLVVTICALAQPAMAQYAPPAPLPQAESGYDRLEQYLWDGAVRNNTAEGYQTYLRRYSQGPHADQARYQLDRMYGRAPAQQYPQQQQSMPYPQQTAPAYPQQPPRGYPQPAPAYAPQAEGAAVPVQPTLPPAPEPVAPPAAAVGAAGAVGAPAVAPPVPAAATPAPVVTAAPIEAAAAGVAPSVAGRDPDFQDIPPVVPVGAVAVPSGAPTTAIKTAAPRCRPTTAHGVLFEQAGEAEIAAYLAALRVNSVMAYQAYLKAYPAGVFAPAINELVAIREGHAKALAAMSVPGPSQAHARTPVAIAAADYPAGASGAGSATAIWEVAEDGCVQSCRIEKSSGSAALDNATCRVLSTRGSFEPARDSAGKPIRSIETGTFNWTPPAK